jgi:hypothetical protein
MTMMPSVKWEEIPQLVHSAEIEQATWTVIRFENPFFKASEQFIRKLDSLSKKLNYRKKDTTIYGEKYSGISIQHDYVKDKIVDPNYDSLDASSITNNPDPKTGQTLYFTPYGYTFDSLWFEKWDKKKTEDSIDLINWDDRPDLKLSYDIKKTRTKGTSYFVLNDWADIFRPMLDTFLNSNLVLYYGRFLLTKDNMISSSHVDGDIRVHIPVYTNEYCATEFYHPQTGKSMGTFHMPADGSLYLFNGHMRHTFYNKGTMPRLHAVFCVTTMLRPAWRPLFKSYDECISNFARVNKIGNINEFSTV